VRLNANTIVTICVVFFPTMAVKQAFIHVRFRAAGQRAPAQPNGMKPHKSGQSLPDLLWWRSDLLKTMHDHSAQ
jgi:hypothetical protein